MKNEANYKAKNRIDADLFSKRLKEVREDYGLSQTEFGNILGKKQSNVSDYENGKHVMNNSDILLVSVVFPSVNCDYLMCKSDKKWKEPIYISYLDRYMYENQLDVLEFMYKCRLPIGERGVFEKCMKSRIDPPRHLIDHVFRKIDLCGNGQPVNIVSEPSAEYLTKRNEDVMKMNESLVGAIKNLYKKDEQIEDLNAKIKELEAENDALKGNRKQ